MAQSNPNPGQPTPQPQPPPPQPQPGQQPGQPPRQPNEPPRPGEQRQLLTVTGQAWEPPPPPTPTQEELDAIALGEFDPQAPEGQRVKRRSMEGQSGGGYATR